jgi:uncharacterized protein (DUF1778 family)
MATSPNRAARLEARITPEVRRQLKRAAELQGRSLSDFVVSAAVEEAQRTIERTHVILLSIDDHDRLMEALRNPPPPNAALREAFARHRELISE